MSATSIDLAIGDLLTNTPKYGEHNPASFAFLLAQGDLVVPQVVSAIEERVGQLDGGDDPSPFFGLRAAIELLAELNSELSRAALVKLLNTDWQRSRNISIYGYAIKALDRCGNADVVPGLIEAAGGPCVKYWPEKFAVLYVLARKLGGHLPVSPAQAVKVASSLPFTEEALGVIDDFAPDFSGWPAGTRCAFLWFYAARVADVRGKDAALPYYAASVFANPERDTAAWSKFPGTVRSVSEARNLARKYPLAEPFGPPAQKKGWHLW
jgi:hypothetical protein